MDTLSFWISKVLVYENYAVPDFDFKFDDSEHLSNSLSCCGSRRSFYHTLDSGINATPGITEALPLKNFITSLHQSGHCGHFLFFYVQSPTFIPESRVIGLIIL